MTQETITPKKQYGEIVIPSVKCSLNNPSVIRLSEDISIDGMKDKAINAINNNQFWNARYNIDGCIAKMINDKEA